MDIRETAEAFTALLKAGDFPGAGQRFWDEGVTSIEAMGEPSVLHGREAVAGKMREFGEQHEVHGFSVTGPFVNGEQFAIYMTIDVTIRATGERMNMQEVALYTVSEGRITEELFFY